jgi:hypothetical protein
MLNANGIPRRRPHLSFAAGGLRPSGRSSRGLYFRQISRPHGTAIAVRRTECWRDRVRTLPGSPKSHRRLTT